jgi:glycosyltransferase involved in cell wall biosynthesis
MCATKIIADSPSGWEKMVSLLGIPWETGRVIWLGIDTGHAQGSEWDRQSLRKRLGWPEDTIVAIFTGQLYRIKGLDILFEAMQRQPDDRLRLIVLGTGVLEKSLRQACRSNPILGRRIYLGGFQRDVFQYLCGADIFVLPSRQEGTSTSLLEAMSVGLCAVGANVGGIYDVLSAGKCGVLVPAEDPAALAKAMRDLTTDGKWREELGRRGREFVRTHCSTEQMTDRYLELFREIVPIQRRPTF